MTVTVSILLVAANVLALSHVTVADDWGFGFDNLGEIVTKNLNTTETNGNFDYARAYFGPQLPVEQHFKGVLHRAKPEDGCSKIRPPDFSRPLPDGQVWIALIRRSNSRDFKTCNFIEKVLNAQNAGYKAVIIYDYEPDPDLTPMGSDNQTLTNMVNIPAVFVGNTDGLQMCSYSFPDVRKYMTSAEFIPYADQSMSPYKILIPMAFSFMGILLVAVIVMVVRWCQAIRRRQRSRISKSQLKKLPLIKYKKEDQYDCCAICLDDYEEGEKVRLLPCSHTYHQKCIDPWLLKNKRTCPVCKRKVIPRPPGRRQRRNSDSSESDDSDAGRGVSNERTPLLPPPAGQADERLGAVGGATASYGSGLRSPSAHHVDMDSDDDDDDDDDGHLYQSYPSDISSSNRRHRHHYRRAARTSSSSSEGESSESDHDLRRSLLVQVSVTPQSYVGAAHSLTSFHTRPDDVCVPPLPDQPANQDTQTESHDPSAEQMTDHYVDVEFSHEEGVGDDAPLLRSDGNSSMIV